MIFNFVSCKEVIARIIRNTRITDSSYADDLLEWIPEGIDQLETHYQLIPSYTIQQVSNNCVKIPCGTVGIEAISYQGCRMRLSLSESSVFMPILDTQGFIGSVFVPDMDETLQNNLHTRITGSDLKEVNSSYGSTYKIVGNYIQTSFKEGEIIIFFTKRQVDSDGYPMVPDNENYKTALYWYCLMMMIGAGFEHSVFNYDRCYNEFFNVFGPRAIAEVKYPSVDRVESIHRSLTRLIPPQNYYEDFFTGGEQYNGVVGL
jgi:hypothetical protein